MRMMKPAGLTVIAILLCAAGLIAQQNVPPPNAAQPHDPALTNADIIRMVKAGLKESIVLSAIAANDCDFDVSVNGLLTLQEAGISDKIMDAMLAAEVKERNRGSAAVASSAPSDSSNAMPQNYAAMGMSPQMMGQMSAAQRQQIMAMMSQMGGMSAMGGMAGMMPGMGGGLMMSPAAMPRINLLEGTDKKLMTSSMAQMAQSTTKGGPGAGSAAGSTLRSFATQGLTFAAIAGGGMFAAPAMGIATGMMGGMMGGRPGMPTTTYIWALPGRVSSNVLPTTTPKFELDFGDIVGLDPEGYEPVLVHLPQTNDNWRLVGATKQKMSYMGPGEPQSMIDEERAPLKAIRHSRGHIELEPASPLAPGEYAVVLRPTKKNKPKKGESQSEAEQAVFYSAWDFSVPGKQ